MQAVDKDKAITILKRQLREKKLRLAWNGCCTALFLYVQPLLLNLAVIAASGTFKKGINKRFGAIGKSSRSDIFYLYQTAARLFWPNVLVSAGFVFRYWEIIAAGVICGIVALYVASKDLSKLLGVGTSGVTLEYTKANLRGLVYVLLAEAATMMVAWYALALVSLVFEVYGT